MVTSGRVGLRGWNVLVRNIVDGSTFGASDARGFGVGRLLFAVGFAVVGAIGLGAHDFVLHQQPVPKGLPWRETLASISGALLLLAGQANVYPAIGSNSHERGLYFADKWDKNYQTPIECHDQGEHELPGGLLYTRYGKGAYVFTAYAWFRQSPAGVPGAYRIFANLVSNSRVSRP